MLIVVVITGYLVTSATSQCPQRCVCLQEIQMLCNDAGLVTLPSGTPWSIRYLSMTGNRLRLLSTSSFDYFPSLRRLVLDDNLITRIKPFTFKGLLELEELSLQNNKLTSISQFSFAGLRNLTSLDLSSNRIARLDSYAFTALQGCKMLLLQNNPLKIIEKEAFNGASNVEFLYFPKGIGLIEQGAFNGMASSGPLKLNRMTLDFLPPYTFKGMGNLSHLTISNSKIRRISPFAFHGNHYIGHMVIINNLIAELPDLGFQSNLNLVKDNGTSRDFYVDNLTLRGNTFEDVKDNLRVDLSSVREIRIYRNSFPCDCRLHTLLESGILEDEYFMQRNECNQPAELEGLKLDYVNVSSIAPCQGVENITENKLPYSHYCGECGAQTILCNNVLGVLLTTEILRLVFY